MLYTRSYCWKVVANPSIAPRKGKRSTFCGGPTPVLCPVGKLGAVLRGVTASGGLLPNSRAAEPLYKCPAWVLSEKTASVDL